MDFFNRFYTVCQQWGDLADEISTQGWDPIASAVLQTRNLFGRDIKSNLELDVAHTIDDFRVLIAAIRESPTKFDYPKLALERLKDLEMTEAAISAAQLRPEEANAYRHFVAVSRDLLAAMSRLPVPEEGYLGFRSKVLTDFDFLRTEFGFSIGDTSPVRVVFVSNPVEVAVEYAPQLPETTLEVTVPEVSEWSPFRLDDFFYSTGLGLSFPYECFDLLTRSGLADFIDEMAAFIKINAAPILRGDRNAYLQLAAKAQDREQLFCSQMEKQNDTDE